MKKTGDVTPLIHAMRIESMEMAVVLLGAFSRYINHLQDEDLEKPETKRILKMLSESFHNPYTDLCSYVLL